MAAIQWIFYQALNPRMKSLSQQEKLTRVATLPYEACPKSIRFYFFPEKPVTAGWQI
jgi:hypothetical protein